MGTIDTRGIKLQRAIAKMKPHHFQAIVKEMVDHGVTTAPEGLLHERGRLEPVDDVDVRVAAERAASPRSATRVDAPWRRERKVRAASAAPSACVRRSTAANQPWR